MLPSLKMNDFGIDVAASVSPGSTQSISTAHCGDEDGNATNRLQWMQYPVIGQLFAERPKLCLQFWGTQGLPKCLHSAHQVFRSPALDYRLFQRDI